MNIGERLCESRKSRATASRFLFKLYRLHFLVGEPSEGSVWREFRRVKCWDHFFTLVKRNFMWEGWRQVGSLGSQALLRSRVRSDLSVPMLQGIRVIDLTSHLSGPYCTWLLGTLGADVIKVERPEGDPARSVGPHVEGESLYFCSINRNKRSITLDLKVPKDADVLRGLIAKADVLVENMKPGALARLGFSDEAISQLNPGLIYASISGFGQTGPLSARPAFDIIVQAMSGMISITGPKEGSPVRVGASIGDIGAALFATIDIVAALFARERNTGRRRLDISMLDCQLALLENAIARYLNTGQVPRPLGTRDPSIVPFQAFATSDGLVAVAAEGNGMWKALCEAIDAPHLIVDPRFDNAEARLANHGQLEPILADILRGRITAEWVECLSRAGIPVGPVNTIGGAMAEPQVKERRMVSHLRDAGNNGLDFVACPIGERRQDRPAPQLGAQSDEIRAMALGK